MVDIANFFPFLDRDFFSHVFLFLSCHLFSEVETFSSEDCSITREVEVTDSKAAFTHIRIARYPDIRVAGTRAFKT